MDKIKLAFKAAVDWVKSFFDDLKVGGAFGLYAFLLLVLIIAFLWVLAWLFGFGIGFFFGAIKMGFCVFAC